MGWCLATHTELCIRLRKESGWLKLNGKDGKKCVKEEGSFVCAVFFQNGKYSIFFHWYYLSVHSVKHLLLDRRQPSNYSWTLFFWKRNFLVIYGCFLLKKKVQCRKKRKKVTKTLFVHRHRRRRRKLTFETTLKYFGIELKWSNVVAVGMLAARCR